MGPRVCWICKHRVKIWQERFLFLSQFLFSLRRYSIPPRIKNCTLAWFLCFVSRHGDHRTCLIAWHNRSILVRPQAMSSSRLAAAICRWCCRMLARMSLHLHVPTRATARGGCLYWQCRLDCFDCASLPHARAYTQQETIELVYLGRSITFYLFHDNVKQATKQHIQASPRRSV